MSRKFIAMGLVYTITDQPNGLQTLSVRGGPKYKPTIYAEYLNLTETKLKERVMKHKEVQFDAFTAHYKGKK